MIPTTKLLIEFFDDKVARLDDWSLKKNDGQTLRLDFSETYYYFAAVNLGLDKPVAVVVGFRSASYNFR